MSEELLNLTLHVWRQDGPNAAGRFETYQAKDITTHMSFLEMLDVVNEELIEDGKLPIAFDHDCREGICGTCGMVINGVAHGPQKLTTTCQLHMRQFNDGDEIWLEPWRASGFPVLKDLVVDRTALDRIIQAGGYISIRTGSAPKPTSCRSPRRSPTRRWTRRSASAVAPASRPARTRPRASSRQPRSRTCRCCRRGKPNARTARARWSRRWTPRASAAAPTTASAKRPVRRA